MKKKFLLPLILIMMSLGSLYAQTYVVVSATNMNDIKLKLSDGSGPTILTYCLQPQNDLPYVGFIYTFDGTNYNPSNPQYQITKEYKDYICTITINNSPYISACDPNTNTYLVNGYVSFSNPPSTGTLTISDGLVSKTYYPPFSVSNAYSLTGITANGGSHTINATFSGVNCSNSITYTAPQSCVFTPCTLSSVTATPGACNSGTNTYSTSGLIYFSNPPSSGTLTVSDGTASQTLYQPFTSPMAYTLTGITANGSTHTVNASFSATNCSNSSTYTAPQSCSIVPSCSISNVTATPSACNSSTNTYSTSGLIYFSNPPSSGTLTASDGTASQTFYAPFTSPLSYSLTGITANGSTHTVTASFSAASCSKTTTYTAPASCAVSSCTVSITAIPGTCDPSTNTYSVSGRATIFNARGGSTITFTDGVTSQSYTVPSSQVSITYVDYTLTGFTSNGSNHTVTAVVSNGTSCSGNITYSAPLNCSCTTPTPKVNNTAICSGRSATLTVTNCSGTVTWDDGTSGATRTVSPITTTSYTATCTVGACSGSTTATVTVTTVSTPTPSVNSPTICSGSSATLSVSNCASTVSWSDGASGAIRTVSPPFTTSYTATCTVNSGSCTATGTATGTVTVTTVSTPTPSVNSPTICSGSSATLSVSNCAGTVSWSDGASGAIRTVSPSFTTSYTATCTVNSGSCTATGTATSTVTVTPKPTPTVNSPTICAGSSATLTVSNCSGSVTWNDGTTGLTKTVSPTTTTTYTATCSVGTCTGTATSTVTVTTAVNPTPTVNSPIICSGSSATLTVSNCSGSVTWNDGTSGLTKTVSPASTTSYTATCTVNSGSCSGTGTATSTVTVTPKPTPTVNSPTICAGSSATLTVSNCSGSVTWNDGSTGLTKTVSPTTTTTYTATCSVGTCTGTAASTVTVTPKPTPTVNNVTICTGGMATLTVSNCSGSVTWNDGTTGLTKTVSPTTTTTYTATCSVGTCTGTATSTVTVTPKPTPTVNSPTICAGSSATLTISNCSGSVTWNDGSTGLTKTVSPTATTTYTATCSVGTCTGTATSTVTVSPKPTPTPTVNNVTICTGGTATLTVSNCNGSISWNTGATTTSITISPTITTSYTVTCTEGTAPCIGSATATGTVTVSSVATPTPSVNSPAICSGSSATLTVSNCSGSVTWNDGTSGLTKTVSPASTTSYTATCTVSSGSCSGTGTVTSTVTVTQKPTPTVNSPTICAGSSATLTVSNCSGSVTWNDGTAGLTKTVSPATTTTYTATCSVGTCTGTATSTVTVSPNLSPTVNNPTICAGSTAILTVSNCSGSVTWNDGTTGLTKTVSPTTTTTYTATCSVGTCTGTTTSTVTVTSKPTVNINTTITCSADLTTYSITFTSNGTVTSDKGNVSGTTVSGIPTGQTVTLTASLNGCTATASATKSCNCPTINPPVGINKEICEGDAIPALTVTVDAGLQADWYSSATSTTKLFTGLSYTPTVAGDFYVEAVNLTSGCKSATRTKVSLVVNTKPTLSTQATCAADGLTYSVTITTNATSITADKGTVSGMSITGIPSEQTVTITATSAKGCKTTVTAVQNCTTPCVLPNFKVTSPATCTNNNSTWSVAVTVTKAGSIKINKGTLSGSGTNYTISNIPAGTSLVMMDSLSVTCKKDTIISPPAACNCITTPPMLAIGQNTTVCKGTTYPTLNALVVGFGTIDWYKQSTGGIAVATGTLSYKPAGVVAANDTFYLQARNLAIGTCPDPSLRTQIVVYAQNCTDTVDLALKKMVDKKSVKLGDVVTFTIKVWNESNKNATGVEVTDNLPAGVQFVSSIASRGNYNNTTGVWTIGNIAALTKTAPIVGDTVTLSIKVKVIAEGVTFNTAEISKTNEKDKDSTPNNGVDGEDDIDRTCVSVPVNLCTGQTLTISIPTQYTNVVWFRNGVQVATGNTYTATQSGSYTYTAFNNTCSVDGCCPLEVIIADCCPTNVCIPLTITKKKK